MNNDLHLKWLVIPIAIISSFFFHIKDGFQPKVVFAVPEQVIHQLPSVFVPLKPSEVNAPWADEYRIATAFAHELDLYQASVAFRRASVLAQEQNPQKVLELEYGTLYCYYLAQKYSDVVDFFEKSALRNADASFTGYHDLLVMLFESYVKVEALLQAEKLLVFIQDKFPKTAEDLAIWKAFVLADFPFLETLAAKDPQVQNLLNIFSKEKKSIKFAEYLNSFLPGFGYFYLEQFQSGITAVALNTLFIIASWHYFVKGHIASGIIFAAFEVGWYDGGVLGVGHEAKLYNERIYETLAIDLLWQNKLFPVLMLQHGL